MPRPEAAAGSPIVVSLLGFSDGDDSKTPSAPFFQTEDTIYREKLAVAYMKESGQYDGGQCRLRIYSDISIPRGDLLPECGIAAQGRCDRSKIHP